MQQSGAGVRRSAYETTDDPGLAMKRPDWEELATLDGEVLLYIVGGTNDSDKDGRLEEVLGDLVRVWGRLDALERDHRLDFLREPDLGFAWAAWRWSATSPTPATP